MSYSLGAQTQYQSPFLDEYLKQKQMQSTPSESAAGRSPWMTPEQAQGTSAAMQAQKPSGNPTGDGAAAGLTTLAMTGSPAAAAVVGGASFLNSYLGAKAEQEEFERKNRIEAYNNQARGEQNALANMTSAWGRALT